MAAPHQPTLSADHQDATATTKRVGRPRADVRSGPITAWVPTAYHDRLIRLASAQRMSVSGLVKQILILRLDGDHTE